ncbi:MAG: PrsW family glutamic-type intramembrane protease [Dehalococcoidia bacterium]|nr:PrsW family glutamic-type intramembrane protease [Dehalococcoidia bacterium]
MEQPALTTGAEQRAGPFTHLRVVLLALSGGALGLVGAFFAEARTGGLLLLPLIAAPIIEEMLKPAGVFLALVRWPQALRGQLYRALLCAGAGVVFGLLESLVYVTIYAPDHPDWYVPFRFSVPVAMHAGASYVVGLGVGAGVVDWVNGRGPLPKTSRNYYVAGVAIHALYNLTAVTLALAGPLDF